METLIRMVFDSKTFLLLVAGSTVDTWKTHCATKCQSSLSRSCPLFLSFKCRMKSSLLNRPRADARLQKCSLSQHSLHWVQVAYRARYFWYVISLGLTGTICQVQWREHSFIPASILSQTSLLHNALGCRLNILKCQSNVRQQQRLLYEMTCDNMEHISVAYFKQKYLNEM